MKLPFTGRCQCGAVRYECAERPNFMLNCSCLACQRTSGASQVSVVNVHTAALRVTGDLRHSTRVGDSGRNVRNVFCSKCGSRMFSFSEILEGSVGIMAASLDDRSWFKPSLNIYAASAPPWYQLDRNIPTFDTVPAAGPGVSLE